MRKIAAMFLVITMLTVFVSCNKDGNEDETTFSVNPATTTISADSTLSESQQSTTADKNAQMTYVLTTAADKTVPWENTTRFEIIPATTTTTEPETSFQDPALNISDIETPTVNIYDISTMPTTAMPTTIYITTAPITTVDVTEDFETDPDRTTEKDTTKKTTTTKRTTTTKATTAKVSKIPVGISINDVGYNSNTNEIILGVSSDGWSSDFKSTRKNISVQVDGSTLSAPCSVSSSQNADGCYEVTIDLSDLGINSGSSVTYTINEGLIQTKAGTQYNTSYTGTYTVS